MLEKSDQIIKMDEEENQEKCPKCGRGEIQSESCSRCGLLFMKYYEVQARKSEIAEKQDKDNQPLLHITRRVGALGWASVICGIIAIFFIGISLGKTNILTAEEKRAPEIKRNIKAVKYYNDESDYVRKSHDTGTQGLSFWVPLTDEKRNSIHYIYDGKTYFKEGVMLSEKGDFKGAAEKFEEALKNLKAFNHKGTIALTNLNLAICYQVLNKDEDSLSYFEHALDISRENGFEKYEARALQGGGLIYSHLGQYEKALTYLDEALKIHGDLNDKKGEAQDWLIKGIIKYNRNAPGAGNYLRKALSMSKEIGDPLIEFKASRLLNRWLKLTSEI